MIIAPLVFSTLVVGVAKLGDLKAVGRIGGKTMLWFISASFVSLLLGCLLVNLFKPGLMMDLELPAATMDAGIDKGTMTLKGFITHIIPSSVIEAMATNEILQIVIFSLLFGVATAANRQVMKIIQRHQDSNLRPGRIPAKLRATRISGAKNPAPKIKIMRMKKLRYLSTETMFSTFSGVNPKRICRP